MSDLDEAKYDAKQMQDMMKSGKAMANAKGDPSYPIADKEDLGNAIKAVGRGGGSHADIRKHIMSRAAALKMSDMIPADWKSAGSGGGDKAGGAPKKGVNPFAGKESVSGDSKDLDLGDNRPAPSEVIELGESVPEPSSGRKRKIQLIQAGWSKNGRYYPASVLAEAARARIFPAGTPMYADHPTLTEKIERPERSIRDLAARLDSDARYDPESKALVSEATSFGTWNTILNGPAGIAEKVEVSVRCFGELSEGTAEGREGLIVEKITEGRSVDFVTEGAAGGRVLELLEAAQKEIDEAGSIGASLESRIHTTFTIMCDEMYACGKITRDERIALSSGIGDALTSFVTKIERDQPQLYEREVWQGPPNEDDMSESANDQETADVDDLTETSKPSEDTSQEGTEMTESQGGAAPTPGTTRALVAKELAEARRERDMAVARETARALIPRALVDAYIPPSTAIRITESVMAGLPMKDGHLDEAALLKEVARQVEQSEHEMAEALQAAGVGSPRDLGGSSPASHGFGVDNSELDDRLNRALTSLGGMTEAAVKRAVQGRG